MTTDHGNGAYEVFILVLSLYALGTLAVETILPLDPQTRLVLLYADSAVCLLFFADFVHSLTVSRNRLLYLKTWGILDLVSSIPAISVLRISRVARIVRIVRVLRGVRATKSVATFVIHRRAQGTFFAAAALSLLLVVFASVAILQLETAPNANIRSAADAIWWAFATVTTVGYGDRYPVSNEGRMLAAVLMTAGVGLFGTFSGFVAAWFLSPGAAAREDELKEIRSELAELKSMLSRVVSSSDMSNG